jgi:putative RNA 2'-phosphotransferase
VDSVRTSKYLSLVLRHRPQTIGLTLDSGGWVSVPVLLDALRAHGHPLTRNELQTVVDTSDKQRFALDPVLDRIRANQGHSVPVALDLPARQPPSMLYHGTPVRNISSILRDGLNRGQRHHVHLSADASTAHVVGARRGDHVVLTIHAALMAADGYLFHLSDNGVWLTHHVPPTYIVGPAAQTDSTSPDPSGAGD